MKDSLYAQYIREKSRRKIVETNDYFFTYLIVPDGILVKDAFITRPKRGYMVFRLDKRIHEEAKYSFAENVILQVEKTDKQFSKLKRLYEKLGYSTIKETDLRLYMAKEVDYGET